MTNTPSFSDETSLNDDFDEKLAAEGAIAGETKARRREIEIVRNGNEKLDPQSQWCVPALDVGCLFRRGAAQPITHPLQLLPAVPITTRTIIKETDPLAPQGSRVIATWSRRPKDAVFVKKSGTQPGGLRRKNGHSLLELSESQWLIDNIVWQLTLFWPDSRIIQDINEHVEFLGWRDAKGGLHPCGLSETKWALWTELEHDDRGNTYVNLKAKLLGAYREESGPSRDEVALARERCHELKRTLPQYPDPDEVTAKPSLRVVGGDTTLPSYLDDAPAPDPNDPGATPDDDLSEIPF